MTFFEEIEKASLKVVWNHKTPNSQTIFSGKNKIKTFVLSDSKMYNKAKQIINSAES